MAIAALTARCWYRTIFQAYETILVLSGRLARKFSVERASRENARYCVYFRSKWFKDQHSPVASDQDAW